MAKEYGSTVTLVRNGVELNALVAASSMQPDGEHLTLLYLDPAFSGQFLGGAGLQRAMATAFASPLKEGLVNGWKETEPDSQAFDSAIAWRKYAASLEDDLIAAGDTIPRIASDETRTVQPSAADLDAVSEEHKIAAETAGTDGPTSPSADVAAKEEPVTGEEPVPPVQQ